MEGVGGDTASAVAPLAKWRNDFARAFQYYLDRSTPHPVQRWLGTLLVAAIYVLRVFYVQGFYVVSYGLGIYILNLLIGFLSPKVDPELDVLDGASLPTKGSDEFKPFIRRLPEFKFWYAITKAFCIAFLMTFFSLFDVPVFWPILLCYWIVLFVLTMKRQIMHMIKYKYIPFSIGKQVRQQEHLANNVWKISYKRDIRERGLLQVAVALQETKVSSFPSDKYEFRTLVEEKKELLWWWKTWNWPFEVYKV
ncbi:protein RER1B-like [Cucumis melo var. makuwa]|uniref:Protein RER1B-like n=1 Tax=Cucumis melo var. makuwa TaxID=1194695 RepID=A0A5A7VDS6_CUCMM|nr:protein RER1B-like [Cucumis melo var. makuwa]